MPAWLIPAITAGLGGLSSIFGGNNANQNTQSNSTSNFNNLASSLFNRSDTTTISPEFRGIGEAAIQQLFSNLPSLQLDPELLTKQELAQKNQLNRLSENVFNSARAGAFNNGLGFSPSINALASGMAENFRGTGLSNIAGNFAAQRFNLPQAQENLLQGRRAALLDIFRLLPRNTVSTGSTNTENLGLSNIFNTGEGTSGSGNWFSNLLGGLLLGAGQGVNLQNQLGGNNNNNNTQTDLSGFFRGITGGGN